MPLDKFVLIVVCVIVAAGVTVWLGSMVAAAVQFPALGWAAILPVVLIGYVAWRVISDRLSSAEDDHYDNVEK